eukprot:1161913-Pelagomonas_calceolata.AAC.14
MSLRVHMHACVHEAQPSPQHPKLEQSPKVQVKGIALSLSLHLQPDLIGARTVTFEIATPKTAPPKTGDNGHSCQRMHANLLEGEPDKVDKGGHNALRLRRASLHRPSCLNAPPPAQRVVQVTK